MSDRPRVLCLAPSWLGDAVLARPALAWLGSRGCEVEVVARGAIGRVLEDLPGVCAVHGTSARRRSRRLLDAARLRARRYDAVLVLPPSFAAGLAAWLCGARLRVGFASEWRTALLTHAVPPLRRNVHLTQHYGRLAATAWEALNPGVSAGSTVGTEAPETMLLLEAQPGERRAARALLQAAGAQPGALVVAPGARFGPAKRYPPERFARAAREIARRLGCGIVLVGEAADAAQAADVQALLPGSVNLAGRTSLEALIGVLAECAGVLANDSGTMHLAAALGTVVVGVFGSTQPDWTRPIGPRAGYVSHAVWCAPCFASTCKEDFACMLQIEPEALGETFSALQARLPSPVRRTSPRL